jgi:UDP-glucose 4-epimerase
LEVAVGGKSFLVTGGAGFVGSHLVDRLIELGAARVTVVDDLSTGLRSQVNAAPQARLVEGDLLDEAMLDAVMPGHDMVFHLAAHAEIKDCFLHPRRDIEQNVIATRNVLEAMRAHDVRCIAFSSTGSVYGEPTVIPTPEDAPFPVQTSLYSASKAAAEGLLTAYAWGYGFDVRIYRFVSMLGARYARGHVLDFLRKLRRDPTRLDVLGDGHQRKSYIHVSDAVSAMLLSESPRADGPSISLLNVGHEDWIDVKESVASICRTMEVSPRVHYAGGTRGWVGDSPRILLDTTRLRALGWRPRRTIEQSLIETVQFLTKSATPDSPP